MLTWGWQEVSGECVWRHCSPLVTDTNTKTVIATIIFWSLAGWRRRNGHPGHVLAQQSMYTNQGTQIKRDSTTLMCVLGAIIAKCTTHQSRHYVLLCCHNIRPESSPTESLFIENPHRFAGLSPTRTCRCPCPDWPFPAARGRSSPRTQRPISAEPRRDRRVCTLTPTQPSRWVYTHFGQDSFVDHWISLYIFSLKIRNATCRTASE